MQFKRRLLSKLLIGVFYASFVVTLGLCFNNCQATHAADSASILSAGETLTADPTLESQAVSILNTYCVACHGGAPGNGGVHNITDKNSLFLQGLIVPGKGTQGILVSAISPGGNMPLGNPGSMSAQDLTTIENWINSMQVVAGSTGSAPAVPPPPPLTDTYQSLNANVFVPYCVYCHGPNSSQGDGLRLDTYQSVYNSRGDVLEKCLSGSMPRGGPPLTTAELTALQDWINAGAPND